MSVIHSLRLIAGSFPETGLGRRKVIQMECRDRFTHGAVIFPFLEICASVSESGRFLFTSERASRCESAVVAGLNDGMGIVPIIPTNISLMFRHSLLLIFRNFRKFRTTFLINLIGLSSGLACAMLICLWVADEWRMDKNFRMMRAFCMCSATITRRAVLKRRYKRRECWRKN